jgi:environmental stress-induced protein Ves
MILDGEIRIEHSCKYSKNLKKFEQDKFSGDWETKSYGKATDFNLMTKGNVKGEIDGIILHKNKEFSFTVDSNFYFIYVYSGKVNVPFKNKIYELYCGDILSLMSENKEDNLILLAKENSEVIFSKILFN